MNINAKMIMNALICQDQMDGVPLNLAVDCRVYKQCRQVVSGEEQESLQLLPVHQPQLNDRRQRRDVRAQERHRSKDGRQSW